VFYEQYEINIRSETIKHITPVTALRHARRCPLLAQSVLNPPNNPRPTRMSSWLGAGARKLGRRSAIENVQRIAAVGYLQSTAFSGPCQSAVFKTDWEKDFMRNYVLAIERERPPLAQHQKKVIYWSEIFAMCSQVNRNIGI